MTSTADRPSAALRPATSASPTSASPSSPFAWPTLASLLRWVPIRALGPRHRDRIAAHLRELSPSDRYLRFGRAMSDVQLRSYVDGIDFARDQVFGIFNRRLRLVAVAHLAYDSAPQFATRPAMVEFGVSVGARVRGRGYGARLFEHAVMHARNRGTDTLFIHALSENAAMLRIVRRAGATVVRDGSESEAFLKLPPDTLASQVEELMETHVAELNYRLKRHAIDLRRLLDAARAWRRRHALPRVASE
jgi:GNAT superfamily N-acetyltransferase